MDDPSNAFFLYFETCTWLYISTGLAKNSNPIERYRADLSSSSWRLIYRKQEGWYTYVIPVSYLSSALRNLLLCV